MRITFEVLIYRCIVLYVSLLLYHLQSNGKEARGRMLTSSQFTSVFECVAGLLQTEDATQLQPIKFDWTSGLCSPCTVCNVAECEDVVSNQHAFTEIPLVCRGTGNVEGYHARYRDLLHVSIFADLLLRLSPTQALLVKDTNTKDLHVGSQNCSLRNGELVSSGRRMIPLNNLRTCAASGSVLQQVKCNIRKHHAHIVVKQKANRRRRDAFGRFVGLSKQAKTLLFPARGVISANGKRPRQASFENPDGHFTSKPTQNPIQSTAKTASLLETTKRTASVDSPEAYRSKLRPRKSDNYSIGSVRRSEKEKQSGDVKPKIEMQPCVRVGRYDLRCRCVVGSAGCDEASLKQLLKNSIKYLQAHKAALTLENLQRELQSAKHGRKHVAACSSIRAVVKLERQIHSCMAALGYGFNPCSKTWQATARSASSASSSKRQRVDLLVCQKTRRLRARGSSTRKIARRVGAQSSRNRLGRQQGQSSVNVNRCSSSARKTACSQPSARKRDAFDKVAQHTNVKQPPIYSRPCYSYYLHNQESHRSQNHDAVSLPRVGHASNALTPPITSFADWLRAASEADLRRKTGSLGETAHLAAGPSVPHQENEIKLQTLGNESIWPDVVGSTDNEDLDALLNVCGDGLDTFLNWLSSTDDEVISGMDHAADSVLLPSRPH